MQDKQQPTFFDSSIQSVDEDVEDEEYPITKHCEDFIMVLA